MTDSPTHPLPHHALAEATHALIQAERFQKSPAAVRLLAYLLAETLNGTQAVTPYHIASAVMGIEEGFDAQHDSVVRVQCSRLRKMLAEYYAHEGRDDDWRVVLPKGQYHLAIEPGMLDRSRFGPRIAVLPLLNAGGDADIVDGLTQELIHLLAQSRELRLIAPETIFQFRHRAAEPVAVGKALDVDFVLGGSMRIEADKIRVSLQLSEVAAVQTIWSQRYDFALSAADIFQTLEDCAGRLSATLLGPGGSIERLTRGKPQRFASFAAVLKHYRYIETYTPEAHLATRQALEQAVRDSPDYAEAWASLAGIHANEHMFGFNPLPDAPPALDRALAASQRAVQLSPDCIMGQYGLALTHYYREEYSLFRDVAERAIALAPYRTDLNASLGMHLAYVGEWARGLSMLNKARELNPLHPSWYWYPYAADACRRGDFEQALIYAGRLSMPEFFWDHLFMAVIQGHLGRHDKARSALERACALNPAIASAGRTVIGKIFHDPALVDLFMAGLAKAGLTAA